MRLKYFGLVELLAVAWLSTACSAPDVDPGEGEGAIESQIINGTLPASQGALAAYGVVSFGCTGTMITNRHILTAHHCTGRYTGTDWSGTLAAPGTYTVTLETAAGNIVSHNLGFMEPPTPWTLDAGDYAIMTLDDPLVPNGVWDQFYNTIYLGTDASLQNATVLCIGYGATFEATPMAPAGGYRLSSANMLIDLVSGGVLIRNRHSVVGFGGDSGSTCFSNGKITGVQSTCHGGDYYDLNHNMKDDFWDENYNVQSCNSSAPSNFRTWVTNNIIVPANVKFDALPALPGGTTLPGTITTLLGSTNVTWTGINTFAVNATRAGRVVASVTNEPSNTLCPTLTTVGPMNGALSINGRCLGDGLASVITTVN